MDWKPYYRAECQARGAREAVESWLALDPDLGRAMARGGVPSFPHTALGDAGPMQAQVARALYENRAVERVLALGVLHGSALESYRTALDRAAPPAQRRAGFAKVRGAFLPPESRVDTPFGPVDAWRTEESEAVRIDREGLLAAEFSLDTFHAVLRVAADAFGRPTLPVLAAYVGMTRDPVFGSFSVADDVADWLARTSDAATAVVATGDLIHYGTAYGGTWLPGNPTAIESLRGLLRPEIEVGLAGAFAARDLEAAYRLSRERLGNDQREMLAVFSSFLGEKASLSLFAFELSDYAGILDAAPPCVVASALALYGPAP